MASRNGVGSRPTAAGRRGCWHCAPLGRAMAGGSACVLAGTASLGTGPHHLDDPGGRSTAGTDPGELESAHVPPWFWRRARGFASPTWWPWGMAVSMGRIGSGSVSGSRSAGTCSPGSVFTPAPASPCGPRQTFVAAPASRPMDGACCGWNGTSPPCHGNAAASGWTG